MTAKDPIFAAVPEQGTMLTVGQLLVDAGKLAATDVDRVAEYQKKHRLRFGEAAVKLRLVKNADLQLALAKQFDYSVLSPRDSRISREVVAAFDPQSKTTEALRALRSQIAMRCLDRPADEPLGGRSLAVVSHGRKEGRSFLAANLACVFAQLGERTLVIDADLRTPRQHALFALPNDSGLAQVLAGRAGPEAMQRVPDLSRLCVLPAGPLPPNPQELLGRGRFQAFLADVSPDFDVVIVDTSARTAGADAEMVAMRTDATLVVAHRHRTRLANLREFSAALRDMGAPIVGSVLNEF